MPAMMPTFFFVKDWKHEDRLFSAHPSSTLPKDSSWVKKAWDIAKKKLMILPQRTLRQEQAFALAMKIAESEVRVLHGHADDKWINARFHYFLHKKRTQRLFIVVGEALLVPLTGFLVWLPGPNVAFYAVALLLITHWLSFRGIRRLLKKDHAYEASPLLEEWERAAAEKREEDFPGLLERIEQAFDLEGVRKILYK
ncbi:MAG: hypothetical protein FJY82_00215 [Candidatus Aminicenantes bacterium]|nr:hypothetical protein [Candidatus Aminicenantes bacterium]